MPVRREPLRGPCRPARALAAPPGADTTVCGAEGPGRVGEDDQTGGLPMSALAPLVENYVAGAATLRQAVAGMTRDQLVARPVPGKGSTLEAVCHLADFDPILAD